MQKEESAIILPTPELVADVRKYASLKFSLSEIATLLQLDLEQLRRQCLAPAGALHSAYEAGKLESQLKYREKIKAAAEKGQAWAIAILEHWGRQQLEEELGGNG